MNILKQGFPDRQPSMGSYNGSPTSIECNQTFPSASIVEVWGILYLCLTMPAPAGRLKECGILHGQIYQSDHKERSEPVCP